jgi:hypothetical protein
MARNSAQHSPAQQKGTAAAERCSEPVVELARVALGHVSVLLEWNFAKAFLGFGAKERIII